MVQWDARGLLRDKPENFFLQRYAAAYRLEIAHFFECLQSGAPFRTTIADGVAALNAIDTHAPDLAFLDTHMPLLSGIDVASQIACIRPDLPVVISSGLLTDELRSQAEQLGVRALMHKENTFEELASLLQRLLAPAAS